MTIYTAATSDETIFNWIFNQPSISYDVYDKNYDDKDNDNNDNDNKDNTNFFKIPQGLLYKHRCH